MGASKEDEEAGIRKAVDFSATARRQSVVWSGLPCEARFWERKLGPAKAHYLQRPAGLIPLRKPQIEVTPPIRADILAARSG